MTKIYKIRSTIGDYLARNLKIHSDGILFKSHLEIKSNIVGDTGLIFWNQIKQITPTNKKRLK